VQLPPLQSTAQSSAGVQVTVQSTFSLPMLQAI
jgi:hypothetical protein